MSLIFRPNQLDGSQLSCVFYRASKRNSSCTRYVVVRDKHRCDLANLNLQAGSLAQKRLARGLRLNQTEATALIASQLQERIRDGKHSVAALMDLGKKMLGRRHVLPDVVPLLHEIQVEGTFPDGYARLSSV